MNALLPLKEQLALLRASAKTFAREQIAPRAAAIDSGNAFPRCLIGRELFEETS